MVHGRSAAKRVTTRLAPTATTMVWAAVKHKGGIDRGEALC